MATKIETRMSLSEDRVLRLRELARAQDVSETDLVERALDILFSLTDNLGSVTERRGWSAMSEGSLARVWDNEDDARYDVWQELYGAPPRSGTKATAPYAI